MKYLTKYIKGEFEDNEFLLLLCNIVFMILTIPFFLFLLNKIGILINYKGIITIIIASFVFTYMAFEINCRIIIFFRSIKKTSLKKFLRNK